MGQLLAERLGMSFVDLDQEVEREVGRSIPQIFEEMGESAFRELERAAMDRVLNTSPQVIAPGGGWVAQPGAVERVADRGMLIYLRTSASTAARRVASEGGRPLLEGANPGLTMARLLETREPFYARAHVTVSTEEKTPPEVADQVAQLARTKAGWSLCAPRRAETGGLCETISRCKAMIYAYEA